MNVDGHGAEVVECEKVEVVDAHSHIHPYASVVVGWTSHGLEILLNAVHAVVES